MSGSKTAAKACDEFTNRMREQGVEEDMIAVLHADFHAGFLVGVHHVLSLIHFAHGQIGIEMWTTADLEIGKVLERMEHKGDVQ